MKKMNSVRAYSNLVTTKELLPFSDLYLFYNYLHCDYADNKEKY